ncbi:MAG: hypothetical protein IPQ13_04630 [Holophagaceae bacterium]|nr:hypothetical protein [Holophagaceae bacterium]
MKLRSHLLVPALMIACGASAAHAQESWDAGFKLVAGNFSGADGAGIGQSKNYGVAMFGTYILSRRQSLEFDGGYRYFPTATTVDKGVTQDDKTDGYYASALYRWGFRQDLYVHAGLRASQFRVKSQTFYGEGDSAPAVKGGFTTVVKPMVGAGARLSDQYSVELNLVNFETANIAGAAKSGLLVEVALAIHL